MTPAHHVAALVRLLASVADEVEQARRAAPAPIRRAMDEDPVIGILDPVELRRLATRLIAEHGAAPAMAGTLATAVAALGTAERTALSWAIRELGKAGGDPVIIGRIVEQAIVRARDGRTRS